MPLWRLFAQDGDGWLDLNIIIAGTEADAELAALNTETWRCVPVCAELIQSEQSECHPTETPSSLASARHPLADT